MEDFDRPLGCSKVCNCHTSCSRFMGHLPANVQPRIPSHMVLAVFRCRRKCQRYYSWCPYSCSTKLEMNLFRPSWGVSWSPFGVSLPNTNCLSNTPLVLAARPICHESFRENMKTLQASIDSLGRLPRRDEEGQRHSFRKSAFDCVWV